MCPVEWSQKLSVGIEQVDAEHQKLVAIFNQLDEASRTGKGTRIMAEILTQLVEYTVVHFRSEEELMTEAEYPQLSRHVAQHRQLVQKVSRFQAKFNGNGRRITKEMLEFLNYWLTNHILHDDMEFGRFYAEREATVP